MNARNPSAPVAPFVDCSGQAARRPDPWRPLLITREAIDAEIERLAAAPRPTNGRRMSRIVHPQASLSMGITPGTDITIQVLLPGERTTVVRTNANQLELCIRGGGVVDTCGGFRVARLGVWTLPPMQPHSHHNDGDDLWVRLTYSNAPLLRLLGPLYEEEGSDVRASETEDDGLTDHQKRTYAWQHAPDIQLTPEGARMRGYEYLTDIPVVDNPALHWPWELASRHLNRELGDDLRTIMLLYHPATERRAGTTHSYFATWARFAPGTPPFTGTRGHRHTSASINYHVQGHGSSVVDGVKVDWKAGDLLLSAPSWSEHAHYHGTEGLTVLTVQDHPMHIALGSLLWQERMNGPIYALGAQTGQTGYVGPRKTGD
jgi:gentisate 1,2-dioxygenase